MNNTSTNSTNDDHRDVTEGERPKTRSQHQPGNRPRTLAAAMMVAIGFLTATMGFSGAASAANVDPDWDGHIVAESGATADVTIGCSAPAFEISIDNTRFTHVRVYFLDRATSQGAWGAWSEIGNRTISPRISKDPHRTYATYWQFWDGNAGELAGEWVPFFSGYQAQRSGIWCGPNGAAS